MRMFSNAMGDQNYLKKKLIANLIKMLIGILDAIFT